MKREELIRIVEKTFDFLVQEFGFNSPVKKDFGREVFLEYERNADTISVSFELGSVPLVEVLIPVE